MHLLQYGRVFEPSEGIVRRRALDVQIEVDKGLAYFCKSDNANPTDVDVDGNFVTERLGVVQGVDGVEGECGRFQLDRSLCWVDEGRQRALTHVG